MPYKKSRSSHPVLLALLALAGTSSCGRVFSSLDDKFAAMNAQQDANERDGEAIADEINADSKATDDAIAGAQKPADGASADHASAETTNSPEKGSPESKEKTGEKNQAPPSPKEVCAKYHDGAAYSPQYQLTVKESTSNRDGLKNRNCLMQYGPSWRVLPDDARNTLASRILRVRKLNLPEVMCLGSDFFGDRLGYCASSGDK